jgi:hypothetical protein
MTNINLVHLDGIIVLHDYIKSLNIINKIIHLNDFSIEKFIRSNDIYIFTQMWIEVDTFPKELYTSKRFIFLNVEMLTENNRWNHIYKIIKKDIRIADYSIANITFIKDNLKILNESYVHEIIYLPYQYNIREIFLLENIEKKYKYDIGIINALPKKDSSVNSVLKYKRTEIYEKLLSMNYNCINITGWDNDRDKIIKECKIILNIHHFEPYKIFEHIRCDRLIFSNKIIISEKSLNMDDLDIFDYVIWKDYDKIIDYINIVLNDFETYQNCLEKKSKKDIIFNRYDLLKKNYFLLYSKL